MAHEYRLKRIYEPFDKDDGFRVLVDRLWPRGLSKAKAHIDLWLKDIAPSDDLRHRFHDKPEHWKAFVAAYEKELKAPEAKAAVALLREKRRTTTVSLLYAARDQERNNAVALKDWLERNG
ncbi:MAG TPA: DUF488 family protein [Rhizomicrobium sp.]|nr:DUF488 family protein [Rhizomicrobium sp.]